LLQFLLFNKERYHYQLEFLKAYVLEAKQKTLERVHSKLPM